MGSCSAKKNKPYIDPQIIIEQKLSKPQLPQKFSHQSDLMKFQEKLRHLLRQLYSNELEDEDVSCALGHLLIANSNLHIFLHIKKKHFENETFEIQDNPDLLYMRNKIIKQVNNAFEQLKSIPTFKKAFPNESLELEELDKEFKIILNCAEYQTWNL